MMQVWHPYTSWECLQGGMYESTAPNGMSSEDARLAYRDFLSDLERFREGMQRVAREWPISAEHFLTNPNINRIAWLGQSAMCITTKVPCIYRGGFMLLDDRQKYLANLEAARFLNEWIRSYERQNQRIRRDLESERLSARHSGRSTRSHYEGALGPVIQGNLFSDPTE